MQVFQIYYFPHEFIMENLYLFSFGNTLKKNFIIKFIPKQSTVNFIINPSFGD